MSSLGSLFPVSIRNDFSIRQIEPGSVFRIHVDTTTPPKVKRLVVLAISGDNICVGYLFINSQINPNYFSTARLRALHISLLASEQDYLDHDSYLDCSDIKNMNFNELKDIISQNPQQYIGKLSNTDIETAKNIVKNAPTISKTQKEKYNLI